jgi:hypothetical protein
MEHGALLSLLQAAAADSPIRIEQVLTPLAAALSLSFVVERVVEFAKNIVDVLPTSAAGRAMQKPAMIKDSADAVAKAFVASDKQLADEETVGKLDGELIVAEARLTSENDPAEKARLQKQIDDLRAKLVTNRIVGEWEEAHPPHTIVVEDATDPDDGTTLRTFVIQSLALVVGILAAHFTGLRLFSALAPTSQISAAADFILTGLFIGGGSAPAHALIQFITERKVAIATAPERAEVAVVPAGVITEATTVGSTPATNAVVVANAYAGAPAADPDRWLDIPYSGGVDLDKLETIHRRRTDPDLVVFHHTAMPLKSTFEDLVRVIKERKDSAGNKWVTGYNCAVLADGSIHPFCRWDRYGNHAQGYNARSLGIALNGNFETDPSVAYSNPDGRYGAPRPTEAQLDSAARVVALWTHLYPAIALTFPKRGQDLKGIIPHKYVSPKTCPGNMFPYDQFAKLVTHYHQVFASSAECRSRIDAFRLRPYLFADPSKPPGPRPGGGFVPAVPPPAAPPVVPGPIAPVPSPTQ